MDLTSTILALGLILLIVIPIAIYNIKNKQKENRFQQAFHAIAEKLDLAILDFDRWDNSIIAIDKHHKRLFFYR
jgi:type II secretory pathway pseudopilin PulG